MNKAQKKYYKEIKNIFPINGKYEKRLISDYKNRINELAEQSSDITYGTLNSALGTPKEIASTYYDGIDSDYLIKHLHIKNMITTCFHIFIILLLIFMIIITAFNIKLYIDANNAIVTYEKIIIK